MLYIYYICISIIELYNDLINQSKPDEIINEENSKKDKFEVYIKFYDIKSKLMLDGIKYYYNHLI